MNISDHTQVTFELKLPKLLKKQSKVLIIPLPTGFKWEEGSKQAYNEYLSHPKNNSVFQIYEQCHILTSNGS